MVCMILRHGLRDDEEALNVEATLIDYIGLTNLTNEQGGANSNDYGITRAESLQKEYSCESFDDKDTPPFIIIKVRQEVVDDRGSFYEACRYAWKISPQKVEERIVFCVLNGIVREVFVVEKWKESDIEGRYEFIGKEAPKEIKNLFINKRIPEQYRKKGMASPVLFSKHSI